MIGKLLDLKALINISCTLQIRGVTYTRVSPLSLSVIKGNRFCLKRLMNMDIKKSLLRELPEIGNILCVAVCFFSK